MTSATLPDLRPALPLPEALSREYLDNYLVLPLGLVNGRVRVAAAGEPDVQALDDLASLLQAERWMQHGVRKSI